MIDPQIQAMLDQAMKPQGAGPQFAQQQPWTMMNPSGGGMPGMPGAETGGMNPMMQQLMMSKMMGAMGGNQQGPDIRKQKMQQQHQQAMQTAMMQAMRGRG